MLPKDLNNVEKGMIFLFRLRDPLDFHDYVDIPAVVTEVKNTDDIYDKFKVALFPAYSNPEHSDLVFGSFEIDKSVFWRYVPENKEIPLVVVKFLVEMMPEEDLHFWIDEKTRISAKLALSINEYFKNKQYMTVVYEKE